MFIKSIFYRVHFLSLGTYERAHVYIHSIMGGTIIYVNCQNCTWKTNLNTACRWPWKCECECEWGWEWDWDWDWAKWGNGLTGRGNASGKRCCRHRRRRVVSHVLQIKMSGFHLRVINNHNKQIQTHIYMYIYTTPHNLCMSVAWSYMWHI